MGERTHRNVIHPRLGDNANPVQPYPARGLQNGATGHQPHAFAHEIGRHVVEQDDVGARVQRRLHLGQPVTFHFQHCAWRKEIARSFHCDGDVAIDRSQVVVLDEDRRGEVESVVHSAPGAHRILLQTAPARRRFPRVENLRPRSANRVDVAGREGGHPRHPLQKIEGNPLGRQHSPRVTGDVEDRFALGEPCSVLGVYSNARLRVELVKGLDGECDTRHDTVFASHQSGPRAPIAEHGRDGRHIVEGAVFLQGRAHERGHLGT